ncbi:hypothetical protein RO3G_13497 [Rhizopus delemar RA 99-880]|uniref:Uncharacterized protein n=1 Tax=Rhizopus delemar (strain RA 99-880 / ATCC MYA-4621 / FGSC 9543 / NRRL 43880) TaxID=246409 RepID=I1CK06_RHIO9|nr:hypothetical protein RO3G_13497 [Rhizopus delemar RA 99-880]|eukprot:EIE88786.1 hypothetical protein RO3G_13497 [Rhizopus delemar RA 99-880]
MHYSDRNILVLLIHNDYATELRQQVQRFKAMTKDGFDPCTIEDPLSFLLNLLPTKLPRSSRTITPWILSWCALSLGRPNLISLPLLKLRGEFAHLEWYGMLSHIACFGSNGSTKPRSNNSVSLKLQRECCKLFAT